MDEKQKGRRVLLIIDVQPAFLNERTRRVADFLQALLARESFDLVIQCCWENHPGSRYETELGYGQGMAPAETAPYLPVPNAMILRRSTYSAADRELLRLLRREDTLYVAGLETDACVLATLFDLWDAGFRFRVYRDGVETGREALSQPALELIARQFGREVLL